MNRFRLWNGFWSQTKRKNCSVSLMEQIIWRWSLMLGHCKLLLERPRGEFMQYLVSFGALPEHKHKCVWEGHIIIHVHCRANTVTEEEEGCWWLTCLAFSWMLGFTKMCDDVWFMRQFHSCPSGPRKTFNLPDHFTIRNRKYSPGLQFLGPTSQKAFTSWF
jgi:hypothetical protein